MVRTHSPQSSPRPAPLAACFLLTLCAPILGAGLAGCVEKRALPSTTASFTVTFEAVSGCGTAPASPCIHGATSQAHRATIRSLTEDGELDTSFNGSVVISLIPAGLLDDSFLLADGRKVRTIQLTNGEARDVDLSFARAFGEVRLLVEDLGYTRVPNVMDAACYDLYPAPGCYARDDDDPGLGSGAAGVSDPVYFTNPRLYDIQYTEVEAVGEAEGWPSPLNGFRPTVDGDSRVDVPTLADCVSGPEGQRELVVVTSITVDGFFVTDVCNAAGPAFASLYVYNFNTPEELEVGDCLLELTGTIQEFQGFTEMKNPFWIVDCDPEDPACQTPRCLDLLPAPVSLDATLMADQHTMEGLEAGVVEITDAAIASEVRSCDLNDNGALSGDDEWACSRECGDDIDCFVEENYRTYFQWTVHKGAFEVNVVSRGTLEFDPEQHLGETVTRITGTLRHLDFGRPPWTIEPRDDSDFEL